jgi:NADPH:quinone reductase
MHDAPERYRAWSWTGGSQPSDLVLVERPRPCLAPGEVLVRNVAIGLNPVDWKVLDGSLVNWQLGKVPGVDGAGTIVAIGDGVDSAKLGQRVAYHQDLARPGSFAEYTAISQNVVLRVPDDMDFPTAASFPCPALTAWLALEKVPAKRGKRILIAGAGGSVGQYLIQLASARGFHVTAMAHPRHHARLSTLGAEVLVAGPWHGDVGTSPESAPFFAVFDAVSGAHARALAASIEANGHLICIQDRLETQPWPAFGPAISLHEVALGALHRFGTQAAWADLVFAGERMLGAIATGALQADTRKEGQFSSLPDALDALKNRSFSGKVVVLTS